MGSVSVNVASGNCPVWMPWLLELAVATAVVAHQRGQVRGELGRGGGGAVDGEAPGDVGRAAERGLGADPGQLLLHAVPDERARVGLGRGVELADRVVDGPGPVETIFGRRGAVRRGRGRVAVLGRFRRGVDVDLGRRSVAEDEVPDRDAGDHDGHEGADADPEALRADRGS